jgi:hypothetical protein
MSVSAIDQVNLPSIGAAARVGDDRDDRDGRFADVLRDSIDQVRRSGTPERRLVPRIRSEHAIPTAREARQADAAQPNGTDQGTDARPARPARLARPGKDDASSDNSGDLRLANLAKAKRKLAQGDGKAAGGPTDTPNADTPRADTPRAEAVTVKAGDDASAAAQASGADKTLKAVTEEPAKSEPADPAATAAPIVATLLLAQPVAPLAIANQNAGQNAGSLPTENAAPVPIADAGAVSAAPAGFQALIAPSSPDQGQQQARPQPAASPSPDTPAPTASAVPTVVPTPAVAPTPTVAPTRTDALAPTDTPKPTVAPAAAATPAQTVVITPIVAPTAAPTPTTAPTPAPAPVPAPALAPAPAPVAASANADGAGNGASALPAGTIVTVSNQAQLLVSKPIAVAAPLNTDPTDDGEAAATQPADATASTGTSDQTVDKPVPAATGSMAAKAAEDGLSQPSATGAVATNASQPDMTAAPQANTTASPATVPSANEPDQAIAGADKLDTAAPANPAPQTSADAGQPAANASATAHTQAADQAQANQNAAAGRQAMPQQVADQVAVHITKAIKGGDDHIKINLRPESLGQVEVQLKISSDGRVQAVVQADKPETLELLQRDARGLERALHDAGLKTDSGSLSFNLRGQDQQRDSQFARNEFHGNGGAGGVDVVNPEDEISPVEAMVALSRANGGIDVRV